MSYYKPPCAHDFLLHLEARLVLKAPKHIGYCLPWNISSEGLHKIVALLLSGDAMEAIAYSA